jgi:voltage-gated potassium channel
LAEGCSLRLKVIYEVFMILLIITYGIFLMAPPDQNLMVSHKHMILFDWIVIALLAIEFAVRVWRAEDKRRFFIRNSWELIGLIPFDPHFRFVRLLRFIRLAVLIRTSPIIRGLLRSTVLLRISGFTLVVIMWSSFSIYIMEKGVNPHIQSFGDAIWWSIVTTTTVGYGDISPESLGGRIIAVFLMITGIGMIGTFTANLASNWIEYTESGKTKHDAETDVKIQIMKWIDHIPELTDRDYRLLLDTIALLRKSHENEDEPDELARNKSEE